MYHIYDHFFGQAYNKYCILYVTFPGKHRLPNQRGDQAETFRTNIHQPRRNTKQSVQPNGEGLVPSLSALESLPGASEPKSDALSEEIGVIK